ncbi:MAG: chloride channel protein [Clostridia bacterium]|nr:chloride channel protein [Clostridia bacterium]
MKGKITAILKGLLLSLLVGVCGGGMGRLFSAAIALVTGLRLQNGWLICLLPVAGLLSVWLYRRLRVDTVGTNQVIASTCENEGVSPLLAPAVFVASTLSHLCGASVGREGAALQLGGGVATAIGRLFRVDKERQKLLVYCGMAGVFSGVFGTPLAAVAFTLEVAWVGHMRGRAVIPTLLSSLSAYGILRLLGGEPERFPLTLPSFSVPLLGKLALIAALSALVAMAFCRLLHLAEHGAAHLFKNAYLRIAVGGALLIALTALVGNQTYNGAGTDVIHRVFAEGEIGYEAFLLKLLFTCVAVGVGYKGGEIVPTLFIGATFGGAAAALLGISPALGAAVGLTALFCGATNCLLASALLAAELFSGVGIGYTTLAAVIAFFLSGRVSLYTAQRRDRLREIYHK